MNRRLWAFFVALMVSFTYILPPVPARAEDLEPADSPAVFDSEGADGCDDDGLPTQTEPAEDGAYIPEDTRPNSETRAAPVSLGIPGALGDAAEPVEVTHVQIDDMSPYFLHAGESADTLPLEEYGYAFYSPFRGVPCEIGWRTDDFDNITPGRRAITGEVLLPEGYVYPGGELTVESVVIVYDDSGAPNIRVTKCEYTTSGVPVILPLGASASEVEEAFDNATEYMYGMATCHTEYGDIFDAPFTLDLSAIDTNKTGAYYPVTVDLPGGMTFDGQEFWSLAAHVVPEDEVTLGAIGLWDAGYIVQWLYRAEETELWSMVDDGEWQRQAEPPGSGWHDYGNFLDPDMGGLNGLYIRFARLEPGHIYRFQVQYDGDRFSDVLVLDFTDSEIPKATSENGGDRTGGDRGESDPPPDNGLGTPPPDNDPPANDPPTTDPPDSGQPTTPSADPPRGGGRTIAPHSADTDSRDYTSSTTASASIRQPSTPLTGFMNSAAPVPPDESGLTVTGGSLLAMMEANPNYVTFLHGGMSASIPTDYLQDLSVTDGDVFSVYLTMPEENLFSVSFSLNRVELTKPFTGPFLVGVPWVGGKVSCVSDQETVADAALTDGKAVFALLHTGTYRLKPAEQVVPVSAGVQEKPPVQAPAGTAAPHAPFISTAETAAPYRDGFAPIWVVGCFAFAGAASAFGFWRKRRVRQ